MSSGQGGIGGLNKNYDNDDAFWGFGGPRLNL